MKYETAPDIQETANEISRMLFLHVDTTRMKCFRSHGSSSRGTIARCHALGKLLQEAIGIRAVYALEFISERFDKIDREEQTKIIIHELMHIPKTFGGGFRHHDFVCEKNINLNYRAYKTKKMEAFGETPEKIIKKEETNNNEKKLRDWFGI